MSAPRQTPTADAAKVMARLDKDGDGSLSLHEIGSDVRKLLAKPDSTVAFAL